MPGDDPRTSKKLKNADEFWFAVRYPANLTEFVYSLFFYAFQYRYLSYIPKCVNWFLRLLFWLLPYFKCSPCTERSTLSSPRRRYISKFVISYVVGVAISFCAVALITSLEGRFASADPIFDGRGYNVYNFWSDWANLALYTVVVPIYVALGVIIIDLCWSFQNQKSIVSTPDDASPRTVLDGTRPDYSGSIQQHLTWIIASLVFCIFFSYGYQRDVWNLLTVGYQVLFEDGKAVHEALPAFEYWFGSIAERNADLNATPILYWFMEKRSDGTHYNLGGWYYIALNLGLLIFTVVSVLFFLSASFSVAALRQKIEADRYDSFEQLSKDLYPYISAFILAKWLFLAYIVNTYIWKGSFLGEVANVDVTITAYTIIGSLLLPIPNRIIEITWYARKRRLYREKITCEPEKKGYVPKTRF